MHVRPSCVTVTVRPARVGDLPMIYRAELAYIRDVEPAAEPGWIRAIDRNLELWTSNLERTAVLDADGVAAGFAMWTPQDDAALLVTVQVLPGHRRRGHGRRLLDWFAADAATADVRRLELGVHRDNPARALYEASGWTSAGQDGDHLRYTRTT